MQARHVVMVELTAAQIAAGDGDNFPRGTRILSTTDGTVYEAQGGAAPLAVSGPAAGAAASAPTSLTGVGAVALTQTTHAGKNWHAEPGQTSLTLATANWPDGGELTVINHTGSPLPITLGAGFTGFLNKKGASQAGVTGAATLGTLAPLERATIQVKDGAFVNLAVIGEGANERAWAANTFYTGGEIVRATVASGTIGVGDRIARTADGTSASTFASDVANWTELPDDPDALALAGHAATSLVGRSANSSGNAADIAATADDQVLRRAGGALAFGTVATGGIADNAVTNAKLADMVANTVKVNATAGTADPTDLSVGANTVLGRVAGNIVAAQLVDAQIATATITHAKLQNMAALSVMGRSANSTGVVADIAATSGSNAVLRESGGVLGFGKAVAPVVDPVRVVATANLNINSDLNNGDAIDGVTLATGDRVLLVGQTTAAQNGVYTATASGPASRSADFDGTPTGEVVTGLLVGVSEGTAHADSVWMLTTNGAITVGTTSLVFARINPKAGSATPGNVAAAAAVGTSADYARADHVHALVVDTVTNAMLSNMAANTVKVNATTASADPSDLAIAANQVVGRNSTGNLTGLAVTDAALTVLDDTTVAAMRTTLGAAASANPAFTGDMTLTDTVAGLGPVLKLENDSFAGGDKARLAFEHGSSQNYQAFIQSNLPGASDVDLEFFTTDNGVLNTTAALRLTGNNTVELANALPLTQGGTGATSAGAARTALEVARVGAETAKTAAYTVLAADNGTPFTNTGAAGQVIFTLPAAAAGFQANFAVTAAQELRVSVPSGTINVGGTATAGVFLKSSTVGAQLTVGVRNSAYVVLAMQGTWADA